MVAKQMLKRETKPIFTVLIGLEVYIGLEQPGITYNLQALLTCIKKTYMRSGLK